MSIGGEMSGERARHLAAALYDRCIAAVATKLDPLRWVVRYPSAQSRRAELSSYGFARGAGYGAEGAS